MAEELWRPSLDLALHRNRASPQSRFVQLATVRDDGYPAVRTVVFRGFLGETHKLTFATDAQSAKAREIARVPRVEACWYFHLTREQFRLAGLATLVGPDAIDPLLVSAPRNLWRALSDASRLGFAWPDPGVPRQPASIFASGSPESVEPLPHFALLLLDAHEVDHLELEGNPQHRWRYLRQGQRWSGVEINP